MPIIPMPNALVFYDGNCGLCHRVVAWLVRHDHRAALHFAPLSGTTATARGVIEHDSIVLITHDEKILRRSAAAIRCLELLGGDWRSLAWLLRLVPTHLADWGYARIANRRAGWFATPPAACPRLPPELHTRFLP